ncbi:RNA polymerase-binding protein RbpA [Corynebacterium heidelbergense]|nr:RNA polymerase-binding protein RbpA [Corynebacterium heidelbergense]
MGAVSYETDRDHDLAPRRTVKYQTESGEVFDVPFADDAEIPNEWMCKNGQLGTLMEGDGQESKPVKPPRTHWDMLCERRTMEELDVLLDERIEILRKRRRNAVKLMKEQEKAKEKKS